MRVVLVLVFLTLALPATDGVAQVAQAEPCSLIRDPVRYVECCLVLHCPGPIPLPLPLSTEAP